MYSCEHIPIPESPFNALVQVEETNEEARCEVDAEMKSGNKSVEIVKVLTNKRSEEPNIENKKHDEGRRNVDPLFMESKRPNWIPNGKG